jgi:hypothetical protein
MAVRVVTFARFVSESRFRIILTAVVEDAYWTDGNRRMERVGDAGHSTSILWNLEFGDPEL